MNDIRVALVGVGNVASSLLQGLAATENEDSLGAKLLPVVGFDVNKNKVGLPLFQGIEVSPNCAQRMAVDISKFTGKIYRGPLLDGLSASLADIVPVDTNSASVNVTSVLREQGVEVLIIMVPTGANEAARYYAQSAIRAGCAVVNAMPAEVINSPGIVEQALRARVPLIGDDMKSQIGATAIHRALMELFTSRHAVVDRTLQLDWGGDTDFLNLVHGSRYDSGKGRSKTEAVNWNHPNALVHINASDYIPFLGNRKEAYTRVEGKIFGNQRVRIDVHMEVEDGYNAAGVVLPAAICAGLALRRGLAGPLDAACAWLCKRPRNQITDREAYTLYNQLLDRLKE